MSEEGGEVSVMPESNTDDCLTPGKQLSDVNGNHAKENGLFYENPSEEDNHDKLLQMVTELKFQNEFLKSQLEGLKDVQAEHGLAEAVKDLHEKVESLNRELYEEKQTRVAAEEALRHLREAYSEADAKAQELAGKLAEAQQKLDQEVKEREEKYTELDSKFGRLHKRAKQRIQEIQKEKDDLEARLRDVNETAERASTQQLALQQELERTRQQANEALKAMDAERKQLRSANNK